jgi:hypothetical protein
MARRVGAILVAVLLAGGLAYQLFGAAQYLRSKFSDKVWAGRRLDSVVRSADGSFGGDFAAYISFLRASMPDDATVVLPSGQAEYYLNDKSLMQYFLFPRNVVTCSLDCAAQLADPATFVIAAGDFPAADQVPSSKRLVTLTGELGLYVPQK